MTKRVFNCKQTKENVQKIQNCLFKIAFFGFMESLIRIVFHEKMLLEKVDGNKIQDVSIRTLQLLKLYCRLLCTQTFPAHIRSFFVLFCCLWGVHSSVLSTVGSLFVLLYVTCIRVYGEVYSVLCTVGSLFVLLCVRCIRVYGEVYSSLHSRVFICFIVLSVRCILKLSLYSIVFICFIMISSEACILMRSLHSRVFICFIVLTVWCILKHCLYSIFFICLYLFPFSCLLLSMLALGINGSYFIFNFIQDLCPRGLLSMLARFH